MRGATSSGPATCGVEPVDDAKATQFDAGSDDDDYDNDDVGEHNPSDGRHLHREAGWVSGRLQLHRDCVLATGALFALKCAVFEAADEFEFDDERIYGLAAAVEAQMRAHCGCAGRVRRRTSASCYSAEAAPPFQELFLGARTKVAA